MPCKSCKSPPPPHLSPSSSDLCLGTLSLRMTFSSSDVHECECECAFGCTLASGCWLLTLYALYTNFAFPPAPVLCRVEAVELSPFGVGTALFLPPPLEYTLVIPFFGCLDATVFVTFSVDVLTVFRFPPAAFGGFGFSFSSSLEADADADADVLRRGKSDFLPLSFTCSSPSPSPSPSPSSCPFSCPCAFSFSFSSITSMGGLKMLDCLCDP